MFGGNVGKENQHVKCRRRCRVSRWATDDPTKRFVDLYSLLCHEIWLRVAAHATLSNKGSETAGIDNMTKSNFLGDYDGHIACLRESLKAKTFEPVPVRRVYIPKPSPFNMCSDLAK